MFKRFSLAVIGGVARFARYCQLSVSEFLDDNGAHLSASMSYYILFSMIPLLLFTVSILGYFLSSPDTAERVLEQFRTFLPDVSADLITDIVQPNIDRIVGYRGWAMFLALIGLFWAGTSIFNVVRKTLNIIWGITIPRPFFHERLVEIIMMVGVGLLFVASFWLTVILRLVSQYTAEASWTHAFNTGFYGTVLPGIIMFLIFSFLYRFTPYVRLKWKDVWIEAALAAIAFEVVKWVFINFMTDRFAATDAVYGVLWTVIATLVWAYVSSVVFLFCAEMSSLRYRGVKFWGRGPVVAAEGPLPKNLAGEDDEQTSLTMRGLSVLRNALRRRKLQHEVDDEEDDSTVVN